MSFTKDFFTMNIESWTKLLAEFVGQPNLRFLEIGCYEGRATAWLLENIVSETSTITCVDTFAGSMELPVDGALEQRFRENVASWPGRVEMVKMASRDAFHVINTSFNFIYIDASHVAKDVLDDAINSWRHLVPGGILLFDDYEWDVFDDPTLCPKIAIDSFLAVYARELSVIYKARQLAVRKL